MNAHQIYQTHFNRDIRRGLRSELESGVLLVETAKLAFWRFLPLLEKLRPGHSCLASLSDLLIKNGPPTIATSALSRTTMGNGIFTRLQTVLGRGDSCEMIETLLTPQRSPEITEYSAMTPRELFERLKQSKDPVHRILGQWSPPEREPKTCFGKLLEYHVFEALKSSIVLHRARHSMPLPGSREYCRQN
jgi:hypothetical protein